MPRVVIRVQALMFDAGLLMTPEEREMGRRDRASVVTETMKRAYRCATFPLCKGACMLLLQRGT